MDAPEVLELGCLRWGPEPTHHAAWAPHAKRYVRSDVTAGPDVDEVADAHTLADAFGEASFDVVLAASVWEHLARPWVAAEQVAKVVRPGGIVYVETHQTFPVHGYPDDYFRFTDRALASLFAQPEWESETAYAYPARIIPPPEVTVWNAAAEAWLNVAVLGRRLDPGVEG